MNTSIVPAQEKSKLVVPKPSQAQIIEAMAHMLIKEREEENKKREAKRKSLQAKLDSEFAKFCKKKISISTLNASMRYDGNVHVRYCEIPGTAKMKEISKQIGDLQDLSTSPQIVINEIKEKMKQEMITALAEQPGFKDAVQSAFTKLNITA